MEFFMFQVVPSAFCPTTLHLLDSSLVGSAGLTQVWQRLSLLHGPELQTALQIQSQKCLSEGKGHFPDLSAVSLIRVQKKPDKLKNLAVLASYDNALGSEAQRTARNAPSRNKW